MQQLLNRRTNRIIAYKGEEKTLKEWSESLGININTLSKRIRKWGVDKAFTEPIQEKYIRKRKGAH